ncbi:MAG: FHA domain-containing protein [Planctomycetaceae bacterium]
MALVTLQVLEGVERGRVHAGVSTPVTIGREDDNDIRLNDERVSRFHAKIQEDGDRIILTDLDSTNGTRVNGHPVQLRVLQIGDQLWMGRCVLIFGSRNEIENLRKDDMSKVPSVERTVPTFDLADIERQFVDGEALGEDDDYPELFPNGPPESPQELRPVQRAQLSDLMSFVHDRIRQVLECGQEVEGDETNQSMLVDWPAWQNLVGLEMDVAHLLKDLTEPKE